MYGEKEKRFVFKSVIVGSTSKARIKIINPNKVSRRFIRKLFCRFKIFLIDYNNYY